MNRLIKQIKKEDGVTLVELLAAIAILSIIVTSFLAYFIQAADTNNRTDEVNEATFLAQEEMERVTYLSGSEVDHKTVPKSDNGNIDTTITYDKESGLYRVIVEVFKGGQLRAKMESRLPFAKPTEGKA